MNSRRHGAILGASTQSRHKKYHVTRNLDSAAFETANTDLKLRHRTSYHRDNVALLPAAARAGLFCALASSHAHESTCSSLLSPPPPDSPSALGSFPAGNKLVRSPFSPSSHFSTTSLLPTTRIAKVNTPTPSTTETNLSQTASKHSTKGFTMSDYIDYNLQATYGAEFLRLRCCQWTDATLYYPARCRRGFRHGQHRMERDMGRLSNDMQRAGRFLPNL